MKILKSITLALLVLLVTNCTNQKKEKNDASDENLIEETEDKSAALSLYDRLGGEEGIASLVDDIVDAHLVNPEIKDVFLPLKENPAYFEAFKKHVREFLSSGTGGNATYTGKDLTTAHVGLKTTEKQYMAAIDDILGVLTNHKIDEETQKDMLFILYSLKGAILDK